MRDEEKVINLWVLVVFTIHNQLLLFVKKIVCLKLVFVYRVSLVPQLISQFYYNFVTWQLVSSRIMDPHESTILFLPFTTYHVGKLWQKLWNFVIIDLSVRLSPLSWAKMCFFFFWNFKMSILVTYYSCIQKYEKLLNTPRV